MKVSEIPEEVVELFNELASKTHRRDGYALQALAKILTKYDEIKQQPESSWEVTDGYY